MTNKINITEDDILTLSSFHYYSCEFPGDTYKGIPEDIVREGIKGLDMFLRIASWSRDGKDPYHNPNKTYDQINTDGLLDQEIPF